jgi:hypothetical protein
MAWETVAVTIDKTETAGMFNSTQSVLNVTGSTSAKVGSSVTINKDAYTITSVLDIGERGETFDLMLEKAKK